MTGKNLPFSAASVKAGFHNTETIVGKAASGRTVQGMLPYSPTTLKKDKNKLFKQTSGFYQVREGKLEKVK